jgi:hypothetical protein
MQVVYEVNPEVWSADKEESKPDDGPKSGDVDNRQPTEKREAEFNTTEGVRETFCQYLEGIDPELRAEVRKSGQSSCGMILNSAKAVLRCTVE